MILHTTSHQHLLAPGDAQKSQLCGLDDQKHRSRSFCGRKLRTAAPAYSHEFRALSHHTSRIKSSDGRGVWIRISQRALYEITTLPCTCTITTRLFAHHSSSGACCAGNITLQSCANVRDCCSVVIQTSKTAMASQVIPTPFFQYRVYLEALIVNAVFVRELLTCYCLPPPALFFPEEMIALTQQKLFLAGATTIQSIFGGLSVPSRSEPAAQRHSRPGLLIESIVALLGGARRCDVSFHLWYLRTPVGVQPMNPQKYGPGSRLSQVAERS